ncbi:MAG: hypothetical protein ABII64_06375 [Elusimicrobiota bacterium]
MDAVTLEEIKRKAFHMLTLIYVAGYWFLPWEVTIIGMAVVLLFVITMEALRLNNPSLNKWVLSTLGGVHRKEETHHMSGLVFTLSGSLLTMLIFEDKCIVVASMLYLSFGDSIAAIIGKQRGKNKIWNKKSLEGSLSCFVVCVLVGLAFLRWDYALLGALVATLIETIPWPLNDNFWMPLISAAILSHFIYIL